MPELAIVPIPNGQFAENCFLLADVASGEAVVVDPGEEPERFLAAIDARGWRVTAIWLTHAHVDHVAGVARVKAGTRAPVWLHPLDRPMYDRVVQQGAWLGIPVEAQPAPDHALADGMVLRVGPHAFTVAHTPGHSPGSVIFVGDGLVIGGDVLFRGSIGRTDLPGGDLDTLLHSIRTRLLVLPDTTRVLCGHGPETTVGVERLTNPFLRDGDAWRAEAGPA
ncbi:MAG: MBL fold metallo-hydrolase [Gemmatimonadales bacterium]|nr:MBL fold metallo-hydrolase [Gemmatimonadales bacterium]